MTRDCCETRLKDMIVLDKQDTPQKINRLVKSEVLFVLKNYFDIVAEDMEVDIGVDDFGKYIVSISAQARNMKGVYVFDK